MKTENEIFVCVWDKDKIKEIKRFYSTIEAWAYVVENGIKNYTVSTGVCRIDNSGFMLKL